MRNEYLNKEKEEENEKKKKKEKDKDKKEKILKATMESNDEKVLMSYYINFVLLQIMKKRRTLHMIFNQLLKVPIKTYSILSYSTNR